MSGLRQAALVLHGLADADRAWMLGQLPPEQAGPVGELLAELRELGIPNDPGLAAQALARDPVHAVRTRAPSAANDPFTLMRTASLEQVQRALEGESQGFVAVLLVAGDWPWYRDYLAAQEPARMRALVDLVRGQPGGPRLRTQVVAAVAARLRESTGAPALIQVQPAKGKSLRQLGAMVIPLFKRGRK
jgi:hypothetical protein